MLRTYANRSAAIHSKDAEEARHEIALKLAQKWDQDGDGEISAKEIKLAEKALKDRQVRLQILMTTVKDKIRQKTKFEGRELFNAFRKFDKDGTAQVTWAEFSSVMENDFGMDISAEEMSHLMQIFDVDGDGIISYHEFVQWYESEEALSVDAAKRALMLHEGQAKKAEKLPSLAYMKEWMKVHEVSHVEHVVNDSGVDALLQTRKKDRAAVLAKVRGQLQAATSDESKVSETFAHFDANGDGVISWKEFVAGCTAIGMVLKEKELEELIAEFDADCNGGLDPAEFLTLIYPSNAQIAEGFKKSRQAATAKKAAMQPLDLGRLDTALAKTSRMFTKTSSDTLTSGFGFTGEAVSGGDVFDKRGQLQATKSINLARA